MQCELADVVIIEDTEILCVYLGENSDNAATDCDGTIDAELIPGTLLAVCVLPREDNEGIEERGDQDVLGDLLDDLIGGDTPALPIVP